LVCVGLNGSLFAQTPDPFQPDIPAPLVAKVDDANKKSDGGDYAAAVEELQDVLKQRPNYYRARVNLGLNYQLKGDYARALQTLENAKTLRDSLHISDSSILNSIGWAYMSRGNFTKAESSFLDALKEGHDNPSETERVLNNLGYLYLQKGDTDKARVYLQKAINDYHSTGAQKVLKMTEQYDQRMWAVYGQQPKSGGEWSERHFNVEGDPKTATAIPKPNQTVVAFENVNIRTNTPIWSDKIGDYVHGDIVGYIKPGDRVRALEVVDINPATDDAAWYWIRLSRLPK
jgi:Tfp pilus assembly protein PilF